MTPFGALLRSYRNERGITATALGRPLKLTRREISALETGRRGPPEEPILLEIREALDLTPGEYQALQQAALHSARTVRIPKDVSPNGVRLVHELVGSLGRLRPSQLVTISQFIKREAGMKP